MSIGPVGPRVLDRHLEPHATAPPSHPTRLLPVLKAKRNHLVGKCLKLIVICACSFTLTHLQLPLVMRTVSSVLNVIFECISPQQGINFEILV